MPQRKSYTSQIIKLFFDNLIFQLQSNIIERNTLVIVYKLT